MNSANNKPRRGILCGILCAAAVCSAQDTLPEGVYKIGNGVSPPTLIRRVDPEYSKEARKALLTGMVLLRVIVGTDGKARDFKVLRSLGLGLDESAIASVSAWDFGPGKKDGQPVSVEAQIEVNFRILNKDPKARWHLGRAEFHPPQGVVRPIIEKTANPRVADDAVNANATATFDVNEKGEAAGVHIDKASDDEWSRDVIEALGKWRFTPASKDGQPVSASCTMEFVRGTI
jgi:TonB family protein